MLTTLNRRATTLISMILWISVAVAAQQSAPGDRPSWGTSSESVVVVPATAFMPPNNTVAWSNFSGLVYLTMDDISVWRAGVQLPTGALITRVTLEACDTTSTGALWVALGWLNAVAGTGSSITPSFGTGVAETPGCAVFVAPFVSPHIVDNESQKLSVSAQWQSGSAAVRLSAMRIYYKLQVSPAPGTATFSDVPVGDPLHRFVEALVAAGITGGCGGGNYCPNTPVTRGQMAVFLSAALGLHWPF